VIAAVQQASRSGGSPLCRDRARFFNPRYRHDIARSRRRVPAAYAFGIRTSSHSCESAAELAESPKTHAEESTIYRRTNDAVVTFRISSDISFIRSDYLSRYSHR
jgi:hypothetical protein